MGIFCRKVVNTTLEALCYLEVENDSLLIDIVNFRTIIKNFLKKYKNISRGSNVEFKTPQNEAEKEG